MRSTCIGWWMNRLSDVVDPRSKLNAFPSFLESDGLLKRNRTRCN
jgi:hypothetical protein